MYIYIAVVCLSDLVELSEILVVIAGDWEVFLIALGVTGSERARIKAQHAHSPSFPTLCLLDGLEGWVKCSDRPTYEDIIGTLNSKLITDKPLAALVEVLAQQKSASRALEQATTSGSTSCEPTSPPHQTSSTAGEGESVLYTNARALQVSKALQKRFILQAKRLKSLLKDTFTDQFLPDYVDGFIMELPLSVRDEHEKFFDRKNSEINRASTFDELFTCLSTYWDYLNYTLLQGMVFAHGTEDMVHQMECYALDLQEFRKKTTLNVFWQLEPLKIRTKPPSGFSKFVTKHSITRDSTLEDIENIRLEITSEFHLHKFALVLVHVVEGSVVITWFVPSSVVSQLKKGFVQQHLLTTLHIEDLTFCDPGVSNTEDYDAELPGSMQMQDLYDPGDIASGARSEGESLQTAFLKAALAGDTARVVELLQRGVEVNERDDVGMTALMLAAWGGHTDTVQALAALGADIHIQDEAGMTALMGAVGSGHTDTVLALTTLGADIHIQDKDGWTAMICAAALGCTDTVRALEALGADIHVQDNDGNTALIHALNHKLHSETAEALIVAGSKLNHQLQEKATGWTALFFAAKHGSLPLTKLMLERGADPTIMDKEGSTAYDVASVYGHEDVMKELAQHTPAAAAEPPPPEHTPTTSSTATQPTSTAAQSSSAVEERVFRAVRILAERIEKMALPGRAEKRRAGGSLTGPELILPSQRQRSNTPGGGK